MSDNDRIHELEAKVAELTTIIDTMRTEPARAVVPTVGTHQDAAPTSSRRGMLKLAGAAAVGAAAAAATGALPVAATNGIDIFNPLLPVRNDYTGNVAQAAFLFQAGTGYTNSDAVYDCALAGWSSAGGTNLPHGIYGFTENGGYGVVGWGSTGTSRGVLAVGTRANIELRAAGTAPATRADAHSLGELVCDVDGNVWACTVAGTPGTWRKIAGAATAGAFHALSPGRVYDSRAALPTQGSIASGQNRTISVADKRDPTSGAVTLANFVPAGATSVAANITVVSITGAGFLTVNPGGSTVVESSTINWSAAGQILANGVILTLNATRQLTVVAGGGGTTELLIDITGYYL